MESQLSGDRELMRSIVAGNAEAFERWYRDNAPRLRAFLRHLLLGNEQAAEDVMQEAFIQIWRRPHGCDPDRGSLRGYLFGVARKLAVTWSRRHRPADEINSEASICMSVETSSLLANALDQLQPDQRAILWLREVEGQSYSELAAILEIPIGTVRSRLHNAREALRAVWLNAEHGAVGRSR